MVDLLPERDLNLIVAAHLAGNDYWHGRARAKADEAALAIRATAAPHYKTGELDRSVFARRKNRVDWEAGMEFADQQEASAIEFGHMTGSDADGGDGSDRKWVDGLHVVRNAAIALGGFIS